MFESGRKLLAGSTIGLSALTLAGAAARAEPWPNTMTAMGATSSQQIRISVSVAPTFKPTVYAAAASPVSEGHLCLASNVDPRSFDVEVEGNELRTGLASPVARIDPSIRTNEVCVAMQHLKGSSRTASPYRSVIISPR